VLEAAGLPFPTSVDGATQRPFDGLHSSTRSMTRKRRSGTPRSTSRCSATAASTGWVAATRHSIPWLLAQNPPLSEDVWELYHVAEDFSEARDLAAQNPAKLCSRICS